MPSSDDAPLPGANQGLMALVTKPSKETVVGFVSGSSTAILMGLLVGLSLGYIQIGPKLGGFEALDAKKVQAAIEAVQERCDQEQLKALVAQNEAFRKSWIGREGCGDDAAAVEHKDRLLMKAAMIDVWDAIGRYCRGGQRLPPLIDAGTYREPTLDFPE